MKKYLDFIRISILIIIIIIAIFIAVVIIFISISQQIIKTEIYENELEILTVEYERNGKSCVTEIRNKNNGAIFGFGVDFINDNTAVFDGNYALPSTSQYITIVFCDGYVEYSETRDTWGEEKKTKIFYLKQQDNE